MLLWGCYYASLISMVIVSPHALVRCPVSTVFIFLFSLRSFFLLLFLCFSFSLLFSDIYIVNNALCDSSLFFSHTPQTPYFTAHVNPLRSSSPVTCQNMREIKILTACLIVFCPGRVPYAYQTPCFQSPNTVTDTYSTHEDRDKGSTTIPFFGVVVSSCVGETHLAFFLSVLFLSLCSPVLCILVTHSESKPHVVQGICDCFGRFINFSYLSECQNESMLSCRLGRGVSAILGSCSRCLGGVAVRIGSGMRQELSTKLLHVVRLLRLVCGVCIINSLCLCVVVFSSSDIAHVFACLESHVCMYGWSLPPFSVFELRSYTVCLVSSSLQLSAVIKDHSRVLLPAFGTFS